MPEPFLINKFSADDNQTVFSSSCNVETGLNGKKKVVRGTRGNFAA